MINVEIINSVHLLTLNDINSFCKSIVTFGTQIIHSGLFSDFLVIIFCITIQKPARFSLLPVVAAARQAAGDAGASESGGAGVVAHVVPLSGAHATAFHVAAAHTEAQACEAAHARSVAKAGIVEPRLRHRGRVWVEKEKGGFYLFMKRTGKKDKETNSR